MATKDWKDFLLSSGLPLENDVKRILDKEGCISEYEYSYLKPDENLLEREFSYDLDAAYVKGEHFYELMIECKYRHESTKWIFTPAFYGGVRELHPTAFLHANDYFTSIKFPFNASFPITLAPACTKGIEIYSKGENEKTISQAMHQLSYAFADKVVSAIEHQVFDLLVGEHIFYHIPIIVTTAQLYRLKDDVDIEGIKIAKDITAIAEQHDILILDNKIGVQLNNYNSECYANFVRRIGEEKLSEKNKSFTGNLDHFFSVLSKYDSPRAFIIMRYEREGKAFARLFEYLNNLIDPPTEWKKKIEHQKRRTRKAMAKMDKTLRENGFLEE